MSRPLSNSIRAFNNLSKVIKHALSVGDDVSERHRHRWLDLFVFNHCPQKDTEDLFSAMYTASTIKGELSRWDKEIVQCYSSKKSTHSSINSGIALSQVLVNRQGDDVWLSNTWSDNTLRTSILRANVLNMSYIAGVVSMSLIWKHPELTALEPDVQQELGMHLFGPWKIAIYWYEAIANGTLVAKEELDHNTLWLYCSHSKKSRDPSKKSEIQMMLKKLPGSLPGALMFYVHRQPRNEYKAHMQDIFKMAPPNKSKTIDRFFFSLISLSQHYDKNVNPAVTHAWLASQRSWPHACQSLTMFLSLYPDAESARKNIRALSHSFENKQVDAIALPDLLTI